MAQVLRLLHLSDLHCSQARRWDADPVLAGLAEAVAADVQQGLLPDLVAITGDIAERGQAADYAMAGEWLTQALLPALPDGFPQERILMVPGNHDADRGAVDRPARALQKDLLGSVSQDAIAEVLGDPSARTVLLRRHDAYLAFSSAHGGAPQLVPWWSRRLEVGGITVHLAGLCSSWMSCDDEDHGHLLLGRWQVNTVLHGAEPGDLVIALLHHPWAYLAERDASEVEAALHRQCHLVLRGHLHQEQARSVQYPDTGCIELAAGAVYAGSSHPNAFHWLEVLPSEGQVRVHLRTWRDGRWIVDRNAVPAAPDGVAELALGELVACGSDGAASASSDSPVVPQRSRRPRRPAARVSGLADSDGANHWAQADDRDEVTATASRAGHSVRHPSHPPTQSPPALAARKETDMPPDARDSVYVSYSHAQTSLVDRLEQACTAAGIELRRDTGQPYAASIRAFMQELAQGRAIVVVLSDEYLRSVNCLFELLEASRNGDFVDRVLPVVVQGTPVFRVEQRLDYYQHWEEREQALTDKRDRLGRQDHLDEVNRTIDLYHDIRTAFDWITAGLADMNALTQALHEQSDFAAVVEAIRQRLPAGPAAPSVEPVARVEFLDRQGRVREEIVALLQRDSCEALKDALVTVLSGSPDAAAAADPAATLAGLEIELALRYLHTATDRCIKALCAGGVGEEQRRPVCTAARDIYGWLLLLSMSDEAEVAPRGDGAFRVAVATEVGADVWMARRSGQAATLVVHSSTGTVYGRDNVGAGSDQLLADALSSWDGEEKLRQAKQAVWRAVIRIPPPPEPYDSATHDQELRGALVGDAAQQRVHYVTVVPGSALDDPAVLASLTRDLGLPALVLAAGTGRTLMIVDEHFLRGIVRKFLDMVEHCGGGDA